MGCNTSKEFHVDAIIDAGLIKENEDADNVSKTLKSNKVEESIASKTDAAPTHSKMKKRKLNLTMQKSGYCEGDDSVSVKMNKSYPKSEAEELEILNYLSQIPVFIELNMEQKYELIRILEPVLFKSGEVIVTSGEKLVSFMLIKSGKVSVQPKTCVDPVSFKETGSTIGQFSLLRSVKSLETITAIEDTSMWVVDGGIFRIQACKNSFRNRKQNMMESITILKTVPLFSSMTEKQLQLIGEAMQIIEYEDGSLIFKKGDIGNKFLIIKRGTAICFDDETNIPTDKTEKMEYISMRDSSKVELINNSSNSTGDVPMITTAASNVISSNISTRSLHRMDYMGEISLLQNTPRTMNIVASGTVECWSIAKDKFNELFGDDLTNVLDRNLKRRCIRSVPDLTDLNDEEIETLIDVTELQQFKKDYCIIKQGEKGDLFYIIAHGNCKVTKIQDHEEVEINVLGINEYFGEHALIESDVRSANVITTEDVTCLTIARDSFTKTIGSLKSLKQRNKMEQLLNSLKLLGRIQIAPALARMIVKQAIVKTYEPGEVIVDIGTDGGNYFFIIEEGCISVMGKSDKESTCSSSEASNNTDTNTDSTIFTLKQSSYFGEQELISNSCFSKKFVAETAVRCIVLDKKIFMKTIRPLLYNLEELESERILGFGGFSVVEQVRGIGSGSSFALKRIDKSKLISDHELDAILVEKNIMTKVNDPFIVNLVTTFQDQNYLFMLQEFVEAGDLRTLSLNVPKSRFKESEAKFFIACTILALEALHKENICYRDLKPENILLCKDGFLKLTDFGNATELDQTNRSYTMCGTPDYMAPELWLGKGHGIEVDYWALGVLCYEYLHGETPFELGSDGPSAQCRKILKGTVTYPSTFSNEAKSFIKSLITVKVKKRLGCRGKKFDEIKYHNWYKDFDWTALATKQLEPPFVPSLNYMNISTSDFNEPGAMDGFFIDSSANQYSDENKRKWIDGF